MVGKTASFSWDALDALLQFKTTKLYCAKYMRCSEDTIDRRIRERHDMTFLDYRAHIMQGAALTLKQKAVHMALEGNVQMLTFALKNMAEWTERIQNKVDTKVTLENIIGDSFRREVENEHKPIEIESTPIKSEDIEDVESTPIKSEGSEDELEHNGRDQDLDPGRSHD